SRRESSANCRRTRLEVQREQRPQWIQCRHWKFGPQVQSWIGYERRSRQPDSTGLEVEIERPSSADVGGLGWRQHARGVKAPNVRCSILFGLSWPPLPTTSTGGPRRLGPFFRPMREQDGSDGEAVFFGSDDQVERGHAPVVRRVRV